MRSTVSDRGYPILLLVDRIEKKVSDQKLAAPKRYFALTLAHLALCAAAILRRAEADIVRLPVFVVLV